jgi:serine/threonine protein kinase
LPNLSETHPRRLALLLDPDLVDRPVADLGALVSAGRRPQSARRLACLDRFEILGLIGAGGMGIVFAARDPSTDRPVALKMLRAEMAADHRAVSQFLTEARHMMRLRHPHILPVLEVNQHPKGPYYVMPWIRGGSLARLLESGRPLARSALGFSRQVAEALRHAHNAGLTHRDVKPDNILVDERGRAYLADFGLVRTVFNDSLVDGGRFVGTAAYMSPAVAEGHAEDTRCDIYAFGAVLYELLTGQPPYQGNGTQDILRQIREGPPAPIGRRNPRANRSLVRIAEGAMARCLRDRYAHMADVVADLERVARNRKPLGPHGQQRVKRPHRWAAGLMIFSAGIAVAAGAFALRLSSGTSTKVPMQQPQGGKSWDFRSTISASSFTETSTGPDGQSTRNWTAEARVRSSNP